MNKLLFISSFLFMSCVFNKTPEQSFFRGGKYYSPDSLLLVDVRILHDSLIGNQCFTSYDGSKIDCCQETSLFLKKEKENVFVGKMTSCLNDLNYNVSITFRNNNLIFVFTNDDHEFVKKKNLLMKTNE